MDSRSQRSFYLLLQVSNALGKKDTAKTQVTICNSGRSGWYIFRLQLSFQCKFHSVRRLVGPCMNWARVSCVIRRGCRGEDRIPLIGVRLCEQPESRSERDCLSDFITTDVFLGSISENTSVSLWQTWNEISYNFVVGAQPAGATGIHRALENHHPLLHRKQRFAHYVCSNSSVKKEAEQAVKC